MGHFYQWDEKYLVIGELSTSYLENTWDKGNPEFLQTNPIKNLHILWKYPHHLVREAQESSIPGNLFSILLPEQFSNLTWKEFITWRVPDPNLNTSSVSNKGYRGPSKQDSRYESNQNAYQLLAFKKGIKRKVSQYTTSRMRSNLKLSKEIFWSQPQHMAVKKSWNKTTYLHMMIIVRNYSNQRNTSCTLFSTKFSKVTWAKP